MSPQNFLYWFITGGLGCITFFLIRFYYLVDEIRKDVKNLLIKESSCDQILKNLEKEITQVNKNIHEHEHDIVELRIEIQKFKK